MVVWDEVPNKSKYQGFRGLSKGDGLSRLAAAGKKREIMVRAVPPRGEGVIKRIGELE